ncbi:hypothetical protein DRJ17_03490 [Candidatus Woesearchaeota archaeon]|nr:MAG: hypothetical protein DRJ17_03490 [Candidatus Woesearchaeota archaeon]
MIKKEVVWLVTIVIVLLVAISVSILVKSSITGHIIKDNNDVNVKATLCYNCSDCDTKADINWTYVKLANDINISTGTCIDVGAYNVVIDCQGHSISGDYSNGAGIHINNKNNLTVKNCVIHDFEIGIESSNGPILGYFYNNTLFHFSSRGVGGEMDNATYYRNTFWDCGSLACILTFGHNYTRVIENNISRSNRGILFIGGIGHYFYNNYIFDNTGSGIEFGLSVKNSNISGNTITNNTYGIEFGTIFFGVASHDNIKVVGNNISYNRKDGIMIINSTNVNITKNDFFNTALGYYDINISDSLSTNNYVGINNIYGNGVFDQGTNTNWCVDNIGNYYSSSVPQANVVNGSCGVASKPFDLSYDYCGSCTTCDALVDTNGAKVMLGANINGTNGCIFVGADNVILDCDNHIIYSDDNTGDGVKIENHDNETIRYCKIKNFENQISLNGVDNSQVHDSDIEQSGLHMGGVKIEGGTGNIIHDINGSDLVSCVSLEKDSNNNYIYDIKCRDVVIGILLVNSSNNNISNNHITNASLQIFWRCWGGIYIANDCDDNIISNNMITESCNGVILSEMGPGGPGVGDNNNNKIQRNNITNSLNAGIHLSQSHNNNISKNDLNNGVIDINISTSVNTKIWQNNIYGNGSLDLGTNTEWCIDNIGNYYSSSVPRANVVNGSCGVASKPFDQSYDYCGSCTSCDALVDTNGAKVMLGADVNSAGNCVDIASNNTILNCDGHKISMAGGEGIVIYRKINNTIMNCEITGDSGDPRKAAIDVTYKNIVFNNSIHDVIGIGISCKEIGSNVSFNYIENTSNSGINITTSDSWVEGNTISSALTGIVIHGFMAFAENNTVIRNTVKDSHTAAGISLLGFVRNNDILYNTVYNNTIGGIIIGNLTVLGVPNSLSDGNIIKGNNVHDNRYSAGFGYGAEIIVTNSTNDNITENNMSHSDTGNDLLIEASASNTRVWLNNFKGTGIYDAGANSQFCVNGISNYFAPSITELLDGCSYALTEPVDQSAYSNEAESFTANVKKDIDATSTVSVLLSITTNADSTGYLYIIRYTNNTQGTGVSLKTELGKFIDIISNPDLQGKITSATIKVYYTDDEVNTKNLDEDTLRLYKWNTGTNSWEELTPGGVDTDNNYIWADVTSFSSFGVFGDEVAPTTPTPTTPTTSTTTSRRVRSTSCYPKWECEEWSECIDNIQTRVCHDVGSCHLADRINTKDCVLEIPEVLEEVEEELIEEEKLVAVEKPEIVEMPKVTLGTKIKSALCKAKKELIKISMILFVFIKSNTFAYIVITVIGTVFIIFLINYSRLKKIVTETKPAESKKKEEDLDAKFKELMKRSKKLE